MDIKSSWCAFCKGRCAVDVQVENRRLVGMQPKAQMPGARGAGCRGMRYKNVAAWFYSSLRLTQPLKRRGARGENRWQPIPWETALDEIAGRLAELKQRHGAESLAVSAGDAWGNSEEYKTRFCNLFGTPNIFGPSPICMGPRSLVAEAVLGWYPQMSVRPATRCVVALGADFCITRPPVWAEFRRGRKNGAQLIVIDPRRSRTAAQADIWLQLKPGSDAALLMAMAHHIIHSRRYDREFVDRWCHGFEPLARRLDAYSPERVEGLCDVPAEQIRRAAEVYASLKPAAMVEGMGVEQQVNSTQVIHARCILAALTANIDIEGGEELHGGFAGTGLVTDRQIELLPALDSAQRRKQIAHDRFRLHSWPGQELLESIAAPRRGEKAGVHWYTGQAHQPSIYRAILTDEPYPIKAMITSASNPMVSHANTRMVYRALKRLELYVAFDLTMNPSAQLADYVLPAASWLEREHLWTYLGYKDTLAGCHAALPQTTTEYDRRDDFSFWRELGVRLGQAKSWPWRTLRSACAARMQACDISFDELCRRGYWRILPPRFRKYRQQGFNTPSGKIELYSQVFETLGYDPLPFFQAPPCSPKRTPELCGQYPLVLINGARRMEFMHTMWREVGAVRELYPHPRLQVHPQTAASLGIADDEWVWIETPVGRFRQRCKLFDGIAPGVVHADGQWWYPELPGEEPFLHGVWLSNVNVVLDDDPQTCDPITGSWPQRHTLCRVYR